MSRLTRIPGSLAERFQTVLNCLLAVSIGLATCRSNVADPDLWGHIQYGREVLQTGTLPETATWTYLAENARWVNHENIAELLLAFSFDQFGTPGLIGLKLVAGCLLFGLLVFAARKSGVRWPIVFLTCAVVGSNIQFHWHYRPQILTYVCLAALLLLWQAIFRNDSASEFFESSHAGRRMKRLLWAVPLMCLWTNSHGGFAAGLAIMIAYHGFLSLQALLASGPKHLRHLLSLWCITFLVIGSSLVNPYGFQHWAFMYDALVLPRPEISDWQPLALWDRDSIRFWCLLALSVVGIVSAIRQHRKSSIPASVWQALFFGQNMPRWIIFVLLLWQGVSHCRHMAIVAIVFGFWIPQHLQVMIDRWHQAFAGLTQTRSHSDGRFHHRIGQLSATVVLLTACLLCIGHDASDIVVDRTEFPVAAMEYIHQNELNGKMLVTFNWAQYAIGCLGAPESRLSASRVAVDGRFETCYPREMTDVCLDFWLGAPNPKQRYRSPSSPGFRADAALDLESPDLVLISKHQQPSARVMRKRSDYLMIYHDSVAEVWIRQTIASTPPNNSVLENCDSPVNGGTQHGFSSYPAIPQRSAVPVRLTQGAGSDSDMAILEIE